MNGFTTIQSLPPFLVQQFSKELLSFDPNEDSRTLWSIYEYMKIIYSKKTRNGYNKANQKKWDELIKQFLELYERIAAKEKKCKEEGKHGEFQLFYHFGNIDRKREKIYRRAKRKRKAKADL